MYSYWEKTNWFDKYDYVIVGAGIVGLSAALELRTKDSLSKILVLERDAIPNGASTKNAGFACFGTVSEILDDLDVLSEQAIIELIKLRWDGLNILKHRIPAKVMQFKNQGGFEVFKNKDEFEKYYEGLSIVNRLIEEAIGHKDVIKVSQQDMCDSLYKNSFFNDLESQLNPVLLIRHLFNACKNQSIDIQFSATVQSFAKAKGKVVIDLDSGLSIDTQKLIICTNAFTPHLVSDVDVVPYRNQVLVSDCIPNLKIKGTFHYDKGYIYFRNINNRLLIGGARNIDLMNEQTTDFGQNETIIAYLKNFAESFLLADDFTIAHTWSGIIATGGSKEVIVKQIEADVFLGVRLGGMGVASGSAVAQELINLII